MDVQTEILKTRSVHERLALSERMRVAAWELKRSVIRGEHPDWTDVQVDAAVRIAFSQTR